MNNWELSAQVHEAVFQEIISWGDHPEFGRLPFANGRLIPDYTTNDALLVIERFASYTMGRDASRTNDQHWCDVGDGRVYASSLSRAICMAALKAVENDQS